MTEKFLDKAYGLNPDQSGKDFYDAWSSSYEDEVAENGYATPGRIAKALKKFCALDSSILDFGCGTGLCGVAMQNLGFQRIDGMDVSPEMAKVARDKGIYGNLTVIDPSAPPPIERGRYDVIVACGVIGAGAAPVSVFDDLMSALASRGLFVFSYNDHALADPVYEAKVNEYLDCASAKLLFRDYGPHLPGRNMKSMVYIVEKK